MKVAVAGKVVSITYLIRGETCEICEYRDVPVAYIHGGGSELFPKIERALDRHPVGFTTTATLSPVEGIGEHNPGLTFTDALENVPPELRHVGAELDAENDSGEVRHFRVTRIDDDMLTVDANRPFAGRTLAYEVTTAGIRQASKEKIASGQAEPDLEGLR